MKLAGIKVTNTIWNGTVYSDPVIDPKGRYFCATKSIPIIDFYRESRKDVGRTSSQIQIHFEYSLTKMMTWYVAVQNG